MFRKLFLKAKAAERAEIYGLTDFVLSAAGLMLELAALELLAFGLGRVIVERLGAPEGLWGQPLAILPFCLALMLAAAPAKLLKSGLAAGFGVDPRPLSARLGSMAGSALFFLAFFWMGSWAVYEAARRGDLILWSACLLGCLWLWILGESLFERLRLALGLRGITEEETPEGLGSFLEVWRRSFPKAGALKVCDAFRPGLSMPGYMGRDLVVTGKALAAFTPDSLKTGVVMAIMAQMLKLDRNYLFLRFAAMALAVPGAIIIVHSLGFAMGADVMSGPRLLPLIWLAAWFSRQVSVLIERQLRKYLVHKLNFAVVSVTGNATALVTAIGTMAKYNQAAWKSRWWSRLASAWPAPQDQIDRLTEALIEAEKERAEKPGKSFTPPAQEAKPEETSPLN
jgi:hypothetical protein